MPFQPKSYGLVPMPVPEGLSLTQIMNLSGNLEQMQAERKARQTQQRLEQAFNEAKGDPMQAATLLETQHGDYVTGRKLREGANEIRLHMVDQAGQRLAQHKTAYGQGAQMLKEVEANPALYPELRPKLVELAGTIDPSLVQDIPETYEPQRVRGMLQFAEGAAIQADTRARAAALAKARLTEHATAKKDAIADIETDRKLVSDVFSVSHNQADWDHSLDWMRALGVSQETLEAIGPTWSPAAAEKARRLGLTAEQRAPKEPTKPTTIQGALLAAQEKGDEPAIKGLLALQSRLSTASRDPKAVLDPSAVQAVITNPTIWSDLNPELRGQLLAPLARAGFNFGEAAKRLTPSEKKQIEQWYTNEISRLNRDRRNPVTSMTDEDYEAEKARIEESYRVQMGAGVNTRADGSQKGDGFFGALQRPDGQVSSEISIGVNIDGKEIEIPTLVPTLTRSEIDTLLSHTGGPATIPEGIVKKAIAHARERIKAGKSPFAGKGEQKAPPSPDASGAIVPRNVAGALKGQKPGRYTLSDGSVWVVDSQGAISKGQ